MTNVNRQGPIPMHRLDEVSGLGLEIDWSPGERKDAHEFLQTLGVHRDDHYIFLLQEDGLSRYMVDFQEFGLEGRGLYFILPGQVHQVRDLTDVKGWFLGVGSHLIAEAFRPVFEEVMGQDRWLPLEASEGGDLVYCLELIRRKVPLAGDTLFAKPVLHSLLATFIGLVAEKYAYCRATECLPDSRAVQITRQFRAMLGLRFRTEKRPAAYAAAFNLSLSYLNEMVKEVTGFPVGHWIQSEVMLEVKRLLCHSDLSVKEVAYALGYEDPTYFSRAFSHSVHLSPLRFRQLFRR